MLYLFNFLLHIGRGGLGRDNELKRRQKNSVEMRAQTMQKRAKMEVVNRSNFLENMRSRFKDKEVEKDLYSSQKACQHLDLAQVFILGLKKVCLPKQEIEEKRGYVGRLSFLKLNQGLSQLVVQTLSVSDQAECF